jgi:hypothetical protein
LLHIRHPEPAQSGIVSALLNSQFYFPRWVLPRHDCYHAGRLLRRVDADEEAVPPEPESIVALERTRLK